jgi:hypothetical protein
VFDDECWVGIGYVEDGVFGYVLERFGWSMFRGSNI